MRSVESNLFLCFVSIAFVRVRSEGVKSETDNVRKTIGNLSSARCREFYFNRSDVREGDHSDDDPRGKPSKFYSCMSCEFAEGVRNELLKSIRRRSTSPSFRDTTAVRSSTWTGGVLRKIHRQTISVTANLTEELAERVKIVTDILLDFASAYGYTSMLDTSLLTSLVRLQFQLRCDAAAAAAGDDVIVPKLLLAVNSVQRFETLNCDVPTTLNRSSAADETESFPTTFDDDAESGSTTSEGFCDADRMLLTSVVTSDDLVGRYLSGTPIRLARGETRTVREIHERVRFTDDLDVVYWYQTIVYDVLTEILVVKARRSLGLRSRVFEEGTAAKIDRVRFLYADVTRLPAELIGYFRRLASSDWFPFEFKQTAFVGLRNYLDNNRATRRRRRGETNDDDDDDDVFELPYYDFELNENRLDGHKMSTFLDVVLAKVVDYECFVRLYELLHDERDNRYYAPRTRSFGNVHEFVETAICRDHHHRSSKIHQDPQGPSAVTRRREDNNGANDPSTVYSDRKGCDLAWNAYRYCRESVTALVGSRRGSSPEIFDEIAKNLGSLMDRLRVGTFDGYRRQQRVPFDGIAFHLVPVWDTIRNGLSSRQNLDDSRQNSMMIRFLFLAMTEFNGFGIEVCNPTKKSRRPFTVVGMDDDGTAGHLGDKSPSVNFREFLENFGPPTPGNPSGNTDTFSMIELIKLFDAKSPGFEAYNGIVRINWKGEKKNVTDIFSAVRRAVTTPVYVYALFDVFFKFLFAIMYLETNKLSDSFLTNCEGSDRVHKGFGKAMENCNFPTIGEKLLPERLRRLGELYDAHLKNVFGVYMDKQCKDGASIVRETDDRLINEFKVFGVSFDSNRIPKQSVRPILDRRSLTKKDSRKLFPKTIFRKSTEKIDQNAILASDLDQFQKSVDDAHDCVERVSIEYNRINKYCIKP